MVSADAIAIPTNKLKEVLIQNMAKTGNKNNTQRDESSGETFKRLGKGRTSKAIRAMRTLRSLNTYDHTKEQTQRIIAALTAETEAVAEALNAPKGKAVATDVFDF